METVSSVIPGGGVPKTIRAPTSANKPRLLAPLQTNTNGSVPSSSTNPLKANFIVNDSTVKRNLVNFDAENVGAQMRTAMDSKTVTDNKINTVKVTNNVTDVPPFSSSTETVPGKDNVPQSTHTNAAVERIRQIRENLLTQRNKVSDIKGNFLSIDTLSTVTTDSTDTLSTVEAFTTTTTTTTTSTVSFSTPFTFSIPSGLAVHVYFPEPLPLAPVDEMSPHDLVRELAAVSYQREAETAAALEATDRFDTRVRTQSGMFSAKKVSTNMTQFSLLSPTANASSNKYPQLPPSSAKASHHHPRSQGGFTSPFSAANGTSTTDEIRGSLSVEPQPWTFANGNDRSTDTLFSCMGTEALYHRNSTKINVATNFSSYEASSLDEAMEIVTKFSSATNVTLVFHVSDALHPRTLAFEVPRTNIPANTPLVGASAARDAFTIFKQLLNGNFPSFQQQFIQQLPALFQPSTDKDNFTTKSSREFSLLESFTRVWPHSSLTPAESEARVQALVTRIKDLTGYDFTVPPAALAQTRLGSSHVAKSFLAAPKSTANDATFGNGWASSPSFRKQFQSKKSMTSTNDTIYDNSAFVSTPSKDYQHSNAMVPTTGKKSKTNSFSFTPIVLKSSSRSPVSGTNAPISFTVTTRSLFAASTPTPRKSLPLSPSAAISPTSSSSGFDYATSLLSPVSVLAAPPSSFTPPAHTQRALARFVSRYDLSRPGASPASFDREYHTPLLREMQTSLDAMVAQRKEEEGHMLRATRVKPNKHPQGGYYYLHIDTGRVVSCHDYEKLYLAEVAFATDFINSQAIEGWASEAEAKRLEAESWTPNQRLYEEKKAQKLKDNRVSWWDQDIEEGFNQEDMIIPSRIIASSTTATESSTTTVSSFLQTFVHQWIHSAQVQRHEQFTKLMDNFKSVTNTATLTENATTTTANGTVITFPEIAAVLSNGACFIRKATDALINAAQVSNAPFTPTDDAVFTLWSSLASSVADYIKASGLPVNGVTNDNELKDMFHAYLQKYETRKDTDDGAEEIFTNTDGTGMNFILNDSGIQVTTNGNDTSNEENLLSFGTFSEGITPYSSIIQTTQTCTVDDILSDAISTFTTTTTSTVSNPREDTNKEFTSVSIPSATESGSFLTGIALHMLPTEDGQTVNTNMFTSSLLMNNAGNENSVNVPSSQLFGSTMDTVQNDEQSIPASLFSSFEEESTTDGVHGNTHGTTATTAVKDDMVVPFRLVIVPTPMDNDITTSTSPTPADDDVHAESTEENNDTVPTASDNVTESSSAGSTVGSPVRASTLTNSLSSSSHVPASLYRVFSPQRSSVSGNVLASYSASKPQPVAAPAPTVPSLPKLTSTIDNSTTSGTTKSSVPPPILYTQPVPPAVVFGKNSPSLPSVSPIAMNKYASITNATYHGSSTTVTVPSLPSSTSVSTPSSYESNTFAARVAAALSVFDMFEDKNGSTNTFTPSTDTPITASMFIGSKPINSNPSSNPLRSPDLLSFPMNSTTNTMTTGSSFSPVPPATTATVINDTITNTTAGVSPFSIRRGRHILLQSIDSSSNTTTKSE